MQRGGAIVLLAIFLSGGAGPLASAQQPSIVQDHWYHSYATLTLDLQAWEDDYPEIVRLTSAGTTLHGRQQWVLQISDWSVQNKSDGTAKEKVYIDGGHHGNEHLGTELAFLTAEFYIEGWGNGDSEALEVLRNTELHIMVLLNADGNDADTRWNMNQVDLNRNYDHHWTEEETASGDGPFSEPETSNNADYMHEWVTDADLYVTMHTGTWILAYPWGFTPNMPSDWELFEFIRDDIHEKIDGELPIRNANAGIYPTHGTSRDYGYGVMGYPCFTFETDDEQFLLGSLQSIDDRLALELEVMRYLISNVWFWRARLSVDSLVIVDGKVDLSVSNMGRASTANATLHYVDELGGVLWHSGNFSVNASNQTEVSLDAGNLEVFEGGHFQLHYQKRVIDASIWVNEPISSEVVEVSSSGFAGFGSGLVGLIQFSKLPLFVVGVGVCWVLYTRLGRDLRAEE
ncbi:MAG: M14 family metallopeptidase [Candidatus Thalassarchaeaceae archaeon]|jgi:hypothetical protein|nr:M14 family metallopeptidase [Candidatus Thalassarchaeaceae archaeon]